MAKSRRVLFHATVGAALLVLLSACSTGPAPPAKGTPAFYWQAAKETFETGDYLKTAEHLDQVARPDGEFTSRAQPWLLVVTAGMTRGYMQLADSFQHGGRANKANPTPFRRYSDEFFARSNRQALQFGQAFLNFQKSPKEASIELAMPYPKGNPMRHMALTKVENGILVTDDEVTAAEKQMLERGVLMATCRASGSKEDVAKAQQVFTQPPVKIPRETFMFAMAELLSEIAELYGPYRTYQPERLEFFADTAMAALKEVPESKETKELAKKIDETKKKAKRR